MDIMRPGCKFSGDIHDRPSTERRHTSVLISRSEMWQRCMGCKSWKALAESVHAMKMHVRDTHHRSWNCSLDMRLMRRMYGFKGSFARIEAQTFLFLQGKQHGCMISCLLLHQLLSAPADVRLFDALTGWFEDCNWAPPLSNSWPSFRRLVALTKLYWRWRVKVHQFHSFVAAHLDDNSTCMDKHSQTTSEEICRVPPSRMRG